jgi:Flp pilus assembly protein TadD
VERNPKNPAYLDSLGWAYYQSGDLSEARNWLRRALDLAPQSEDIRVHIKLASGDAL